jgi:hypothetical protein
MMGPEGEAIWHCFTLFVTAQASRQLFLNVYVDDRPKSAGWAMWTISSLAFMAPLQIWDNGQHYAVCDSLVEKDGMAEAVVSATALTSIMQFLSGRLAFEINCTGIGLLQPPITAQ